jgi:iron complex transport system substrate-binding protein
MKINKWFGLILSVGMLLGILAGCATPIPAATPTQAPVVTEAPTIAPTAAPITVTDALGRAVEFTTLPQRIVVAGKATPLLVNSIFLFPEAIEKVISYENRGQSKTDFIRTVFPTMNSASLLAKDAGPEQIAPLNPDLVIMKTYMQEKLGTPLEALGIKVVYLDLETPEKFYSDLRTIGQVLGNSARAEELVTIYQKNDRTISDALVGLSETEKPSVLMLQYSNTGGVIAFSIPPANWLQTILVENAGGKAIWKETPTTGGWTVVTLEQIAAWNPNIIILVDYKGKAVDVVAQLKTDPTWQSLDAIKNNKLFAFPMDFLSWDQPDSRWSLGELWLATKIHPDKFTSIKILDEVTAFYKTHYGLDDATITEKVLPLLTGDF